METSYKGTNKMITGIVFGVLTFWLFAQALLNVVPAVQKDLGVSLGTVNIAISLTSLFSGMFIVAAGGLADKIGRKKMANIGFILSIIGSLCLVFAQRSRIAHYWTYLYRIFGCSYYAINHCLNESLF